MVNVCSQLFHFVCQESHVVDQGAVKVSRGAEVLQHEAVVVLAPDPRLGVFDTLFAICETCSNVPDVSILLNYAVSLLCLRDTVCLF